MGLRAQPKGRAPKGMASEPRRPSAVGLRTWSQGPGGLRPWACLRCVLESRCRAVGFTGEYDPYASISCAVVQRKLVHHSQDKPCVRPLRGPSPERAHRENRHGTVSRTGLPHRRTLVAACTPSANSMRRAPSRALTYAQCRYTTTKTQNECEDP